MAYNKKVEGTRFTIVYDGSNKYFRTEAFMIAEYLEEHYSEVDKFFGLEDIDYHTTIKIFSSLDDYAQFKNWYMGDMMSPTEIAYAACGNIYMMTKSAVAERRKGTGEKIDYEYMGEIALHELTHVAHHVFDFVNNTGEKHSTRLWFREGLATYLGNKSQEKELDVSKIPYNILTNDLAMISYGYYYSMIKYMIDHYTHEEVLEIMKDLDKIDEVGLVIYNALAKRDL